jgi:hypothetical protein
LPSYVRYIKKDISALIRLTCKKVWFLMVFIWGRHQCIDIREAKSFERETTCQHSKRWNVQVR